MKSQTLINTMKIAFFVAAIAALIIAIWASMPVPILLATVSWNG
jgi:hypothetical protein